MFWISQKNFIALMEEAHRHGQSGSAELNSEVIQDLLIKAKPGNFVSFKLWTIAQIQKLQLGKKIVHPLLGEGQIVIADNGSTAVSFNGRLESIDQGNEIWSYPIAQLPNLKN